MAGLSEMNEIIPGLILGSVTDVEKMILSGAKVLVPLAFLDGSVWNTIFRGEILYYPIEDMKVLPDDVLNELVDKIIERMDAGKKVAVFCASGHGRTGYVAGCVLARRGIKDPIGYLRRFYSPKAVETDKQATSIYSYARALTAPQISKEGLGENFFEYRSYRGTDPYIYVSYSEWDHDVAPEIVRILNEQGFNVAYDRRVLEGWLWSQNRSDAIEDSSLVISVISPCERNSHIRYAESSFAELLKKPMIYIVTDETEWRYLSDLDEYVCSNPDDPDFAAKCVKALALKGIEPQPEKPDEEKKKIRSYKKRKDRKWDLGITYYPCYVERKSYYRDDRQRDCNLRTREATDYYGKELGKLSEEDLYRAIGWNLVRFDLFPRSSGWEYIVSSKEDSEFRKRLVKLGGKPVPEIKEEYDKAQKRIDDYWRDYPYMDEFEYVDSKFDD